MTEISKEKRIKEELTRVSLYFENAADNEKAIISPLIQNAAFMKVTLEDLQEIINTEGVTEAYQNGANQHGIKPSAALQSYNNLMKVFASVIKTLSSYLPPEEKKRVSTLFGWTPQEKTEEELEKERQREEERRRKINEEIARAAEWQRQQWEREKQLVEV